MCFSPSSPTNCFAGLHTLLLERLCLVHFCFAPNWPFPPLSAFSRAALAQCFVRRKVCPTCNADLADWDVSAAPRNVVLAGLVEGLAAPVPAPAQNQWSGCLNPASTALYELELRLTNSKFVVRPSLFVAVVDRSGSMSGGPWRQVQAALTHILGEAL